MLRVSNIKLDIDEKLSKLRPKVTKKLKVCDDEIIEFEIFRESIDARKRGHISFIYSVNVVLKNEKKILTKKIKDVTKVEKIIYTDVKSGRESMKNRPVVVGSGPAGLFATLLLAQRGYKPIMIERGVDVDTRTKDVEAFWKCGKFNPKSNVQFGEGGAGTFSDGKLTSRTKDTRIKKILSEFINFGAPEDIAYAHMPHVGTDILKNVVKNIRQEITSLGGEVRFDCMLTKIISKKGCIEAIEINKKEIVNCDNLIVACGHSARDTYEMLHKNNVKIIQKPFAIGARIEHPQLLINKAQYKEFYNHPRLGAASYRLTHKASNNRSVYTFCMCPGGSVIASSSFENQVVTNGMSEHARDKSNANSALLVNIRPEDFNSENPLAGLKFQQKYEELAFKLGGSDYKAPCQTIGDFLQNRETKEIGSVNPSYNPGVKLTNLSECLPDFVTKAMRESIVELDKKIKGFAMKDALLTGVETRSSAPVRIVRDETSMESVSVKNLYPCGEGAGYAGGIITAAIDGLKCAEKIIQKHCL